VPRLEAHTTYRVEEIAPSPTDWAGHGATATGAVLDRIGLPGPRRAPESVLVVHLVAT
jgi:hypothetical protein